MQTPEINPLKRTVSLALARGLYSWQLARCFWVSVKQNRMEWLCDKESWLESKVRAEEPGITTIVSK